MADEKKTEEQEPYEGSIGDSFDYAAAVASGEEPSPDEIASGQETGGEEEPETQSEQAKQEEPGGAGEHQKEPSRFSKVDPSTLSPELRAMYDHLQREFAMKEQALSGQSDQLQRLMRYVPLIDAVEKDPRLQEHLRSYNQQVHHEAPKPGAWLDDSFKDYDPEDRASVRRIVDAAARYAGEMMWPYISGQFQPLQQLHDRTIAAHEETSFLAKYPDWNKHVAAEDLAAAKQHAPQIPIESLYKILAFDKVTSSSAAKARQEAVAKVLGRSAPAERPRTRPEITEKPKNWDQIWDFAMRQRRRAV